LVWKRSHPLGRLKETSEAESSKKAKKGRHRPANMARPAEFADGRYSKGVIWKSRELFQDICFFAGTFVVGLGAMTYIIAISKDK
jgi:hypothetical protein